MLETALAAFGLMVLAWTVLPSGIRPATASPAAAPEPARPVADLVASRSEA